MHRMDISLLSTPGDPEQLRTLAIAMVQKAMAESQDPANVVPEKDRNIADLQNRIPEEQMKPARQQRSGKKCESLAGPCPRRQC